MSKAKIKGRTGRSVGRPRKPEGERLERLMSLRARRSVVEWYGRLNGEYRSWVARAAVGAMSHLSDTDLAELESLGLSHPRGLEGVIARALCDHLSRLVHTVK
jgi:hypothetical protein